MIRTVCGIVEFAELVVMMGYGIANTVTNAPMGLLWRVKIVEKNHLMHYERL